MGEKWTVSCDYITGNKSQYIIENSKGYHATNGCINTYISLSEALKVCAVLNSIVVL